MASVSALPRPHRPGGIAFPKPRATEPTPYFQDINVTAPHTFEWGYRRGNPDHNREQYLSQKDHTFKAKLKWHDGYEGHGEHYFDYNHVGPKEPVHHAPAYAPPKPTYGGPALTNKVYTQINFSLSDQCSHFRERPTIQLIERGEMLIYTTDT